MRTERSAESAGRSDRDAVLLDTTGGSRFVSSSTELRDGPETMASDVRRTFSIPSFFHFFLSSD